ncbi:hypothetical protein [Bdellovibrio bacteriovorus]
MDLVVESNPAELVFSAQELAQGVVDYNHLVYSDQEDHHRFDH